MSYALFLFRGRHRLLASNYRACPPRRTAERETARTCERCEDGDWAIDWGVLLGILNTLALILYVSVSTRSRIAVDKADESKQRVENESKPLDAINGLADSFKAFIEFDREREKSHQAERKEWRDTTNAMFDHLGRVQEDYKAGVDTRTAQISKQLGISGDQAESIAALQSGQDEINKALGDIRQKQGPTLEETNRIVKELQDKIAALPADTQQALKPLFDKIDEDILALKADFVKALANLTTQPASAPTIQNNITVPPAQPATLPEQNAQTQKLDNTLPSAEPDPTQPTGGKFTITPPEVKG